MSNFAKGFENVQNIWQFGQNICRTEILSLETNHRLYIMRTDRVENEKCFNEVKKFKNLQGWASVLFKRTE